MKLDEKLYLQFGWVGSNLPILTLLTLAAVVDYYAGYFFWTVGLAIPPIDTQDLGLSSVALVAIALGAYNIWTTFDLGKSLPGIWKIIAYIIGVLGLISSSVVGIWNAGIESNSLSFWQNLVWLAITLIAISVVFLTTITSPRIERIAHRELMAASLLLFLLLWLCGMHAFTADLASARLATFRESGETRELYVLRVLSSVAVAFNPKSCSLLIVSRSGVSSIEFLKSYNGVQIRREGDDFSCVFK
jgi:NADH:ubiquinone oxidoreductase subunit 6 (subunit J)